MSSVAHYNSAAQLAPKGCAALRSSHRAAKHAYISHAADLAANGIAHCHVLDFACGRGGDLPKCQGCASYVGVDSAELAVVELHRRAREMDMDVHTHVGDACDVPTMMCNLALCNFAVHYFCDTQEHCTRLVRKVAACLQCNGVFCGTYERIGCGRKYGVARHVVIGDCVDAVEWHVPYHHFFEMALQEGLALVWHAPLAFYDSRAEPGIWVFMMRQADRRPPCGTTQTGSATLRMAHPPQACCPAPDRT